MCKLTRILAVVLCSCGLFGAQAATAASRRAPVAAEATPREKPVRAPSARDNKLPPAEAAQYAAREAAAPELGSFKGGGGVDIYIGGTALAIALLVVLLVLLI